MGSVSFDKQNLTSSLDINWSRNNPPGVPGVRGVKRNQRATGTTQGYEKDETEQIVSKGRWPQSEALLKCEKVTVGPIIADKQSSDPLG